MEYKMEKVEEIIDRLKNIILDLDSIKQDFVDIDEEYFDDDELQNLISSGMKGKDPEVVGFLEYGIMSKRIDILYFRDIDLFTKSFALEEGKLQNIKRLKLIDKILP